MAGQVTSGSNFCRNVGTGAAFLPIMGRKIMNLCLQDVFPPKKMSLAESIKNQIHPDLVAYEPEQLLFILFMPDCSAYSP